MANKIEIKRGEIKPQQTVEEFDALLEAYKAKNPQKYAVKKAKGEFDKYRKTLAGYVPPEVEEKKVEGKIGRPPKNN